MGSSESPIGALILGILMTIFGMLTLIRDYIPVAIWNRRPSLDWVPSVPRPPLVDFAGLFLVPGGIAIVVMSIIAIRRGEGKPKKYTEEDAVKAKAAMDRMYFREHGRWPEEEEEKGKKDA